MTRTPLVVGLGEVLYAVERPWGALPAGVQLRDVSDVAVDAQDRVYVFQRTDPPIVIFDGSGAYVGNWGSGLLADAHGIFITPDNGVLLADGIRLHCWGYPGTAPGAFSTPHAIRVHPDGRLLVADRENNRIQIFSPGGEYLSEWGDLYHPMDIYIDAAGLTYVTDQIPRLTVFSSDGMVLGRCRPVLYQPHGIFGDSRGDLYIAEPAPMDRITKLVRLPG